MRQKLIGFLDGSGISWTIYTLFQTDNHTNTSSLDVYRPDALPDGQPTLSKCQSTRAFCKSGVLACGMWALSLKPRRILMMYFSLSDSIVCRTRHSLSEKLAILCFCYSFLHVLTQSHRLLKNVMLLTVIKSCSECCQDCIMMYLVTSC